jgi:hypothetical protein
VGRNLRRALLIAAVMAQTGGGVAAQTPPAAQTPALDGLKATLTRIREEAHLPEAPPDAGALVTLAKRQLREWVEQQLPEPTDINVDPLNARLNAELKASGLVGSSACSNPFDSPTAVPEGRQSEACGYVGNVQVHKTEAGRDGHYLTLTTSFANAWCGVDGSAYLFQFKDGRWRLVWENEENAESAGYSPAPIRQVVVARRFTQDGEAEAPPPLVLTLSWALGCQSFWGAVRYRLWRVHGGDLTSPPLLSKDDGFWMGDERYIDGQLLPNDLLVEYRNRSVDAGVHSRTFISHFRIGDDDKVRRVAPVALNPRDFVEEWMTQPWQAAREWTEARSRARMWGWHRQIPNKSLDGFVSGNFTGPPLRCRGDPTLWQIGFYPSEGKDFNQGPAVYFLVRWIAPYRFTMVTITRKPQASCKVIDTMPDATDTLFSVTGSPWPTRNPFAPE